MKLVTLAIIKLNRVGTLGRGGFQQNVGSSFRQINTQTVLLDGDQPGHALAKVKELAVAAGESGSDVGILSNATPFGEPEGVYHFREGQRVNSGTSYGSPYAECEVFPALEIEGRYFRLSEVQHS